MKRAALLTIATARRQAANPGRAHADRARIAIGVALQIRTALVGAAGLRTAHVGAAAEIVDAQVRLTGVFGARATVVTGGRVVGVAGLLSHAIADQRAILAGAAARIVRQVHAGSGEALIAGARDAVVAIAVVTAFAAVALTTLLVSGALRRQHADSVGAAHVLSARIAVAAVFRATATAEQRAARARRASVGVRACGT